MCKIDVKSLPPTFPASTPAAPSPIPIPYPNIALSDPGAGARDVIVTFEVMHRVLHLDDAGTLLGKVTGNDTGAVVVRAVIADIQLVLADHGFTYLPDPGYEGADSLVVTIDVGRLYACRTSGTITSARGSFSLENAGGIAGRNSHQIFFCASSATVVGEGQNGGIVGYNDSHVRYCYATGFRKATTLPCSGGTIALGSGQFLR